MGTCFFNVIILPYNCRFSPPVALSNAHGFCIFAATMLKYLRLFLLPISAIYGLIVIVRNKCFDVGILKSRAFGLPIISVGNLDVGGAGKSPMTEYLITLFKNQYKIATLSRGYGRSTKGFLLADNSPNAAQLVGDEPAQFKQKFADVTVAVCEKRVIGVQNLQHNHDLIILDDAYQHRALKPGLSILLFDYSRINEPRFLLPAGNLREPFSGRKRANIIVLSKCPVNLNAADMASATKRIRPLPHQQVFFTGIRYGALQNFEGIAVPNTIGTETIVFLLTGIANPAPLLQQLKGRVKEVIHHNYPDHHPFTLKNIAKLAFEFNACTAADKVIITTAKDAQRLRHLTTAAKEVLPLILVLPIEFYFLNEGQTPFNELLTNYVRQNTQHH